MHNVIKCCQIHFNLFLTKLNTSFCRNVTTGTFFLIVLRLCCYLEFESFLFLWHPSTVIPLGHTLCCLQLHICHSFLRLSVCWVSFFDTGAMIKRVSCRVGNKPKVSQVITKNCDPKVKIFTFDSSLIMSLHLETWKRMSYFNLKLDGFSVQCITDTLNCTNLSKIGSHHGILLLYIKKHKERCQLRKKQMNEAGPDSLTAGVFPSSHWQHSKSPLFLYWKGLKQWWRTIARSSQE